jgi:hypothetical protein
MGQPIVAMVRNGKCVILSTTGHELRSFGNRVIEVQMTGGDGVVVKEAGGKTWLFNGQTGSVMKAL